MAEHDANPLDQTTGLPPFDRIRPDHVVPAVERLLGDVESELKVLESQIAPSWEATIGRLDELGLRFEHTWRPVTHLFGVLNSPELRDAYEQVLPQVVTCGLRIKQSQPIYQALKELKGGAGWSDLDDAQRRVVDQHLLSAELAGIGLPESERAEFNTISTELSQLASDFSNHVLDATKAYALEITDAADVEGLPESLLRHAAQGYNEAHADEERASATAENGPWRITLDQPSFTPFMKHCRNRTLREEVYRAFIARASSGEFDNSDACRRILQLRRKQARMLGYDSYADVSLVEKMAPDAGAVLAMLERLRAASWDPANQDMEDIHQLAIAGGQSEPITQWDVGFWAERLRERTFKFTEEELRPYFAHERILDGLFDLVQRLFQITIVADDDVPRWHSDVRYFKVLDQDGTPIAGFYYDPYSRPANKRGGAWMDCCITRRRTGGDLQLPVAHLVCNCTPPSGGKPSLMTFREVETLFHEFGHGLQHMLTTVDYPDAAGVSGIEWDAVELPSQFMENWCYHKPTMDRMAQHYETGEPLPEALFEKLCAARKFRAGSDMLRQLTFGLTDMQLHSQFDPDGDESVFDVQRRVMERTSVLPMLPEDRFLCSFQHIFAGGYAAGYYSYKWAEVLSADAFEAFVEAGLDDEAAVAQLGRRFRDTVLAQGGGRHPMDVFRDFRGREPDPDALLRQYGLI